MAATLLYGLVILAIIGILLILVLQARPPGPSARRTPPDAEGSEPTEREQ